jgi:hypothetical protein
VAKANESEGRRVTITLTSPPDGRYWVISVVATDDVECTSIRQSYGDALSLATDLAVGADDPQPGVLIV